MLIFIVFVVEVKIFQKTYFSFYENLLPVKLNMKCTLKNKKSNLYRKESKIRLQINNDNCVSNLYKISFLDISAMLIG